MNFDRFKPLKDKQTREKWCENSEKIYLKGETGKFTAMKVARHIKFVLFVEDTLYDSSK
jgi:hypothetical protein